MKLLTIFRGSPASGKSTFIKENGLEQYTISADSIRLLHQAPQLTIAGGLGISPTNDKKVWALLFNLVEQRMINGDFIVVDSTNSKTEEFNKYRALAKQYRYRIVCIDFTDVPIDECKRRNSLREEYKRVPEYVIDKMYERFKTQPIPSNIDVVKPAEYFNKILLKPIDLSSYKKIHHIGDIHGCNTALQEYLNGELKDDEMYIFTGDWVDRGIENAEVVQFMISIKSKPNVIFITGNHDGYLWQYSKDYPTPSKEFEKYTRPQLDAVQIDKKELRMLYRKFRQLAYYTYKGKTVIVTHGGISSLKINPIFISTNQLIKGVGSYGEMELINGVFKDTTDENTYQIHGHRNINNAPVQVNDRCFCLEGQVELGGHLRAVTLDETGFKTYEIKNNIVKASKKIDSINNKEILEQLRENKYIKEKQMGNISSFNFTNKAFKKEVWNEQTLRARGLFFNTNTGDIVIRSYDKFFNINERFETNMSSLHNTLKFPVRAFVKYNGYLGLVGYDKETDSLIIASKSTTESDHAKWFENILCDKFNQCEMDYMIDYIKTNNCTLVWEVIDPVNDPHMIKYTEQKAVLLNIIYNEINFREANYSDVVNLANALDVEYKEVATTLNNWEEFEQWYNLVSSENYKYKNTEYVEGFVIQDTNGFMTKIKGQYYSFWKHMRGMQDYIASKGEYDTSKLNSDLAKEFCLWCMVQTREYLRENDIITLREQFEEDRMSLK